MSHQLHHWNKQSKASAEQSVLDLNHKADIHPGDFYASCAPYNVETREVTEWTAI